MSIFERISRVFTDTGTQQEELAEPAEVVSATESDDWRKEQLAAAAKKYGRPFKCAGDDLPREVLIGGRYIVTVEPGADVPGQNDTVTRLRN